MAQKRGMSRRSFIKGLAAAVAVTALSPTSLFASQKYLTSKVLETEKEYAHYLDLPDFNLNQTQDLCDKVTSEMARITDTKTLSDPDPRRKRQAIEALFDSYDAIIQDHFQKEQEGKDIFSLSQGITQGKLDCDLLSYLYFEAGQKAEVPIYGVHIPSHFLVRYCANDQNVNFEPLYDTAKHLRNVRKIEKNQRLQTALGLDPDKNIEHQIKFPSSPFIRKYNQLFQKDQQITDQSIQEGMHLMPLGEYAILSQFYARIAINMVYDSVHAKKPGCISKAMQLAHKAIDLCHRNDWAYTALARANYYARDYEAALEYETQALQRNPGNQHSKRRIEIFKKKLS